MMFRLLVATLALGAAAFQAPAAAGSRIAMSQVSSAAPLAPLAAEATTSRAVVPTMNEGHETQYEMFDPGWVVITLSAYTAVLLKFGGVF